MKAQALDFYIETRVPVVFGVQKIASWDRHGTGAVFWCEKVWLTDDAYQGIFALWTDQNFL